jgi:hypothetical protein
VAAPGEPALVSFRAEEGAAEVRVRGAAAAHADEARDGLVVVHVSGARPVRRVDRLALDTSAFGAAVKRVEVVREGEGLALRLSVAAGARVAASVEAGKGVVVRVEAAAE